MGSTQPTSKNNSKVETGSGDDTVVIICNIFCFQELTKINVLENDKIIQRQVSQIKNGDKVLTYDGNKQILTKVLKIKENKGIFEFYEFRCKGKDSKMKKIMVTGNHTMIIYGKENDGVQFKSASQVKVGDLFRTTDGMFQVYEINRKMMDDSYELRVENGTVLANDILVSTLYLRNNENVKEYQKIIESSKIPVLN